MDIYKILSTKNHNIHYLNRYIRFISNFYDQPPIKGGTEEHHICPKSKDLFPEYKSFKLHPWNKIILTKRQHFIAHLLLYRAFYKSKGAIYSFWRMCNNVSPSSHRKTNYKVSSKLYEDAKKNFSKIHSKNIKGIKNPKASKLRKGMVSCFDLNNNFLLLTKEEFNSRSDVFGLAKNKNHEKSEEHRKNLGKSFKNRIHIYHPETNHKKFIKKEDLQFYINQGYIEKYISYDRKNHIKFCVHCNRHIDSSNFARWHGDKCKLNKF